MIYKKTFWMNVLLVIVLPFIYFLSYATDIDYNYRTPTQRFFTISTQLFFLAIPTITALYLLKPNMLLLRKLVLFGNYLGIIGTILYLLLVLYHFPKQYIDGGFLILIFVYLIFFAPFLINVKALRKA